MTFEDESEARLYIDKHGIDHIASIRKIVCGNKASKSCSRVMGGVCINLYFSYNDDIFFQGLLKNRAVHPGVTALNACISAAILQQNIEKT